MLNSTAYALSNVGSICPVCLPTVNFTSGPRKGLVGQWAFLGFLSSSERAQYPPQDASGNFFKVNNSMVLNREELPAKEIASFLDEYVEAGSLVKDAEAIAYSQNVCNIDVNILFDIL